MTVHLVNPFDPLMTVCGWIVAKGDVKYTFTGFLETSMPKAKVYGDGIFHDYTVT